MAARDHHPRLPTQRHHRLVRGEEHGTGEVLTGLNKGHTRADVLKFVEQTDATVPRGLSVLAVLDNLSAHSIPEIKKWLAHRDQRRWHLHLHSHLELMAHPEPPR